MNAARRTDWLLGVALAVAFSPGIYDLARQWWTSPWSRYSALFALLVAARVAHGGVRRSARGTRGAGLVAIAVAMVLQLLAVLAVMPALARPALVVAATGFLWLRGLAPLSIAWLAIWIVPVPHQLVDRLGGDSAATWLFRQAAALVNLFGAGVAAGHGRVVSGELRLMLDSPYGGLPTLATVCGLTLYAMQRLRLETAAAASWLAEQVALAALLQLLAAVLACWALAAGSLWLAEALIASFAWMVLAVGVLFRVRQRTGNDAAAGSRRAAG
jgi:hypothetical protein